MTSQAYSKAVFIASATQTSTMATTSQRPIGGAHLEPPRGQANRHADGQVNPGVVLVPEHEADAGRGITKALQPVRERECVRADSSLADRSVIGCRHGPSSAIATRARRATACRAAGP